MGRRRIDLTGRQFERWFVVQVIDALRYLCLCDCGIFKPVYSNNLTSHQSKSCGCLDRELSAARLRTHGLRFTRTYQVWRNMLSRCLNPNVPGYWNYGGRGITVCGEWFFFRNFNRDMGKPPSPLHTLERIDNEKGYSKDNCRWATKKEQARNMRSNRPLTALNQTMLLIEWSEQTGFASSLIWRRIHRLGWTPDEAVSGIRERLAA